MSVNGENDDGDVNTLQGREDFGVSELARIGEQWHRTPQAQQDIQRRLTRAIQTVNSAEKKLPGEEKTVHEKNLEQLAILERILQGDLSKSDRKLTRHYLQETKSAVNEYGRAKRTIESLSPRLNSYQEATAERLNNQAVNLISREFSDRSVLSYSNNLVNNSQIQAQGLEMAHNYSYEELEARRRGILGNIGQLRDMSRDQVRRYIDPTSEEGTDYQVESFIGNNASMIKGLAAELAPITAALKTHKSQGTDPESRQKRIGLLAHKAQDTVDFERLREDISNGKGEFGNLSKSEFKKKEVEAANNLIKAFDALRNSAGKTEKEIAQLAKNAEAAANNFKNVEDAAAAGAGSGGNRNIGRGIALANGAAALAEVSGSYFNVLGVQMPMMNMANITGYANLENQKFDSWRAALSGNMTERLNLIGFNNRSFAQNRGYWANVKAWETIGGGAMQATAGGLEFADALTSGIQGKVLGQQETIENMSEGIVTGSNGVLVGIAGVKDVNSKISKSQADIAGQHAAFDAVRALNHIKGYQLQKFRDYISGLYGAGSNISGERGERFLATASSEDFIGRMGNAGISLQQVGQLSSFGTQNLGSMFDINQVLGAKDLERRGLGSAEENMTRMGTLSASSTQNPMTSLESILGRAMAAGMDSSKAMTALVTSTGAMAQHSAGQGITDIGGQISSLLLAAFNRNSPNQELAVGNVINAFQTGAQARNDRSVSFHGMVATSRLQKELGLEWTDAYALQGMDVEQLRELQGKGEGEIREKLFRRGINPNAIKGNLGEALGKVINSKLMSQAEGGGGWAYGANIGWQTITNWLNEGDTQNRARQIAFGKFTDLPDNIQNAVLSINRAQASANPDKDTQATLATMLSIGHYLSPIEGQGVGAPGTLRENQFEEENRAFNQDAKTLTYTQRMLSAGLGPNGSIVGLNLTGAKAQEAGGPDAEEKFSDAAAKAAASFGDSVVEFSTASNTLLQAANKLLEVSRFYSVANTNDAIEVPDDVKGYASKLEKLAD